jgi:hypothetical protein
MAIPARPAAHVQSAVQACRAPAAQPKAAQPKAAPAHRPPVAPHVQAALRTVSRAAAPAIQAKKVNTSGGVWEDEKFVLKPGVIDKTARGADMTLSFTPTYPTKATKIGLVQTVKTIKNGQVYYLGSETIEARSIQDENGLGTSIDQRSDNNNPVYATSGSDATTLGATETDPQFGENGYRYVEVSDEGDIRERVKKAWLRDTPHLRGLEVGEKASSQVFEVTALALEGSQKGSYYGSVSWGWELDAEGVHKLIPLEVVSQNNPSATFMASAKIWNKTNTSGGVKPILLPIKE